MTSHIHKSIVVISWDGTSSPLGYIQQDTKADFDLFIFDYSGKDHRSDLQGIEHRYYLSVQTECKGDILQNIYQYLVQNKIDNFKYIGILDDDICISIGELNKLLFHAGIEKLDVFQASLTHDSYYHHRQFVRKEGYQIIPTWWVEIMAPFYSKDVFWEAGKDFQRSISGTGIDVYLIPTIQVLLGKTHTAVVHSVSMKHCRPIRTDNRVFRNGKTNLVEISELQSYCKSIVENQREKFTEIFIKEVINRRYVYGIPLKYKLKRIPRLLKNLYSFIVDASYR